MDTKQQLQTSSDKLQAIDPDTCRFIADVFSAIGDPSRVMILLLLAQADQCVSDLAAQLRISESAVSQHLRLLRTLRIVRPTKKGRHVFYALDDHHVRELLDVCLEHVLGE